MMRKTWLLSTAHYFLSPVGADTGCPVAAWVSCVTLESHVILAHHETINSGQVHYNMLSHIDDLAAALNQEPANLDIVYGGDYPLPPTEIVVALKGVPSGVPMDDLQMTYFEQTTTDYLSQQLLGLSPFPVLSAKVKNQRGPNFNQRVRRGLQDTGDDWIEVTANVLGSYTPPLDTTMSLDDIVNDAFRYGKAAFIEDIKTGPSRPGSILQGERGHFFAGVSNANFRLASETVVAKASIGGRSIDGGTAISMDAGDGDKNLMVISLCVGLIAVMSMWISFVVYRMKKADHDSTVSKKSGKDKEEKHLDKNSIGVKFDESRKSAKAVDGKKAQTKHKKPASKPSISPETFDGTSGFHDDALPNDLEPDVSSRSETSNKRSKSDRDIEVSGQSKSTHSSRTTAAGDMEVSGGSKSAGNYTKNTDHAEVSGGRSKSFNNRGRTDPTSESEQTHSSKKRTTYRQPAPVDYDAAFAAGGIAQDPDRESALSSRSKGSSRSGSSKTDASSLGRGNERTSNRAEFVDDDEKSLNTRGSTKREDRTAAMQSVSKAPSKSRSMRNRSSHNDEQPPNSGHSSAHQRLRPSSRSRSQQSSLSSTRSTVSVTSSSNPEGLLSSTNETPRSKSSRALSGKRSSLSSTRSSSSVTSSSSSNPEAALASAKAPP
jgi:hypothetical protein